MDEYFVTQNGYDKLVKELEYLKNEKRKECIEKIKEAKSFGDLSENAEYDAAKDEQGMVEANIRKLEYQIENAKIIAEEPSGNIVKLGSKLKIHDLAYDEDQEIQIVGSIESDLLNNRISNDSPLAKALLGKKKGDVVDVVLPEETYQVKILDIK